MTFRGRGRAALYLLRMCIVRGKRSTPGYARRRHAPQGCTHQLPVEKPDAGAIETTLRSTAVAVAAAELRELRTTKRLRYRLFSWIQLIRQILHQLTNSTRRLRRPRAVVAAHPNYREGR